MNFQVALNSFKENHSVLNLWESWMDDSQNEGDKLKCVHILYEYIIDKECYYKELLSNYMFEIVDNLYENIISSRTISWDENREELMTIAANIAENNKPKELLISVNEKITLLNSFLDHPPHHNADDIEKNAPIDIKIHNTELLLSFLLDCLLKESTIALALTEGDFFSLLCNILSSLESFKGFFDRIDFQEEKLSTSIREVHERLIDLSILFVSTIHSAFVNKLRFHSDNNKLASRFENFICLATSFFLSILEKHVSRIKYRETRRKFSIKLTYALLKYGCSIDQILCAHPHRLRNWIAYMKSLQIDREKNSNQVNSFGVSTELMNRTLNSKNIKESLLILPPHPPSPSLTGSSEGNASKKVPVPWCEVTEDCIEKLLDNLNLKSFHFRCGNFSDDTSCYYNISFLEWISIFGILPGSKKNRFGLEVVGASDPESRPKRLQWGLVGVHYYVYVLFSLNLFPHVYSGSSYDWLSTHCFLNHSVLGNEEGIELLSLLNKFNSSVYKSKPLNKFSGFFLSPLASLSSTIAFDLWYSASSFSIPNGMVVANKINVESFSYLIIQSIDALSFGQLIANRMISFNFTEELRIESRNSFIRFFDFFDPCSKICLLRRLFLSCPSSSFAGLLLDIVRRNVVQSSSHSSSSCFVWNSKEFEHEHIENFKTTCDYDENFMDDFEAFEYEPELLIDKSSSPQIIQLPSQPFWSYITINWFVNQTCLSCSSLEIEHLLERSEELLSCLSLIQFILNKLLCIYTGKERSDAIVNIKFKFLHIFKGIRTIRNKIGSIDPKNNYSSSNFIGEVQHLKLLLIHNNINHILGWVKEIS